MKWFYDVKKRKIITGIFVFSVFAITILLYINFNSMDNVLEPGLAGTVQETPVTEPVMATQTPEITKTPAATQAASPTAIETPTYIPTILPTPTTTPTVTPTTLAVTPATTVTPTPAQLNPTPTITLKATPKKTVQEKTNTPVKTSAKPVVVPTKGEAKIELRYRNGNANANTDTIYPAFKVINSGNESIKLSNVKIRYYYTKEQNKNETFWCDSFSNGTTNVIGQFVSLSNKKRTADSYLEISFSEGAGEVKAGESVELSVGFAKNDWSEYNQKNDYSYSTSRTYFVWNKVTLYLSGKLVFGIEP